MADPIAAEQEPVIVKHFDNTLNEYRQMHTSFTTRDSTMFIRKHVQNIGDDPRYNQVELIGLTKDDDISDQDNIIYKDKEYKVVRKIWSKRWIQYFMEIYANKAK